MRRGGENGMNNKKERNRLRFVQDDGKMSSFPPRQLYHENTSKYFWRWALVYSSVQARSSNNFQNFNISLGCKIVLVYGFISFENNLQTFKEDILKNFIGINSRNVYSLQFNFSVSYSNSSGKRKLNFTG